MEEVERFVQAMKAQRMWLGSIVEVSYPGVNDGVLELYPPDESSFDILVKRKEAMDVVAATIFVDGVTIKIHKP